MLLFFITCCFSFIFFYTPLPPWACDMRLLSFWFWKDFSYFPSNMSPKKKIFSRPKVENVETTSDMSLLDLPELVLDSILEKLPPDGLCRMASVCVSLREKCVSDHLWEKHMNSKWSRIVGPTAYRKWQWDIAVLREGSIFYNEGKQEKGLMGYLTYLWPFILIGSGFSSISNSYKKKNNFEFPRDDSIMSWYLALESGEFWFPAQVYNRECGHVGFMLSCYDAELCYDSRTDTFEARYPPHGNRASATESGVTWDRLRASPIDTSPHELHISDCLNELKPGDHVEIQWRRNKEFPYGWWYGIVGHLGTCDGNANYCQCHRSDTVVLEFHQYALGSRWRTTNFSRKHHREEGNEADGFYGGIRKLSGNEEISMWKNLFPSQVLQ